MAPRTGRSYGKKKKKEPTKREQLADLVGDMSEIELAEVQDFIAGSSQGENIRGLQGTVGVGTAAPSTAFAAKRTLGDTGPDAIRSRGAVDASTRAQTQRGLAAQASANTGIAPEEPQGRLSKLKGLVGGGAKAIGGGIKRAADWANQEDLSEGFTERKERIGRKDALAAIKPRQGIMEPSFGGFPATPPAATPPAAGGGEEKTSSQRAAEAAKRAYLAQQERSRGAGGQSAIQMPEGALNSQPPHPKNAPDRFKNAPQNQPPMDQAIRGPAASAMTQGNTTGTQSTNPKRKIGNFQKDGAGGYEDFGQSPVTPSPKKGGNPLTEGSFSTAEMKGSQGITDANPFATKKAPQGPQMRAPIKDSGAVRPDVAEEQEASRLEAEISNLMKMGGPASTDRLKEIFGSLQEAMNLDEGAMGPNAARSNPQRNTLEGTIVPWGEEGPRSRSNQLGPRQKKLSQGAAAKLLKQYGPQFRALSTRNVSRGSKVARR